MHSVVLDALMIRCARPKLRLRHAEHREVVRLGAADGEDDLLLAGAERARPPARAPHQGRARLPPEPMHLDGLPYRSVK